MAQIDRRESILARLLEIAAGITGITRALRNQENVSGRIGPTIGLWDGDESSLTETRGARDTSPRLIEMTPEFRVFEDATAATVGTSLNGFRAAIIKAVLSDAQLQGFVGNNGGMFYRGLSTETRTGERIEGGVSLTFALQYPLIIDEL